MQFVSESTIDKTAEIIGSSENLTEVIKNFKEKQPVILAYLFSENFKLLSQKEREYMMFLALVIWKAFETTNPELNQVTEKVIEDFEENNWEKFHKVISRKFNERIDIFFKDFIIFMDCSHDICVNYSIKIIFVVMLSQLI